MPPLDLRRPSFDALDFSTTETSFTEASDDRSALDVTPAIRSDSAPKELMKSAEGKSDECSSSSQSKNVIDSGDYPSLLSGSLLQEAEGDRATTAAATTPSSAHLH